MVSLQSIAYPPFLKFQQRQRISIFVQFTTPTWSIYKQRDDERHIYPPPPRRASLISFMHRFFFVFIYLFIYLFILAFLPPNWSVSIDNTTTTSIRFSWQNLQTLVGQRISYYPVVVKNSYGNIVKGYIVPGNTTSHVFSGLTAYREYRLSVVGVNYSGNAYNSREITAWTDEGGTCIT